VEFTGCLLARVGSFIYGPVILLLTTNNEHLFRLIPDLPILIPLTVLEEKALESFIEHFSIVVKNHMQHISLLLNFFDHHLYHNTLHSMFLIPVAVPINNKEYLNVVYQAGRVHFHNFFVGFKDDLSWHASRKVPRHLTMENTLMFSPRPLEALMW